jgi:hypothetical protein
MKRDQIKKTSLAYATVIVTALFAGSLIMASQHTPAAAIEHHKVSLHHKAHSASSSSASSVHKVVAVVPETHGKILNATALKKLTKGPYGESDVIGGMMSDGY